jgi:hypothetical protein
MMENGKTDFEMEEAGKFGLTDLFTKGIGFKTNPKEKENSYTQMEMYMREIGWRTRRMEKESMYMSTVPNTREM